MFYPVNWHQRFSLVLCISAEAVAEYITMKLLRWLEMLPLYLVPLVYGQIYIDPYGGGIMLGHHGLETYLTLSESWDYSQGKTGGDNGGEKVQ